MFTSLLKPITSKQLPPSQMGGSPVSVKQSKAISKNSLNGHRYDSTSVFFGEPSVAAGTQ